jgi:hypothetical protein
MCHCAVLLSFNHLFDVPSLQSSTRVHLNFEVSQHTISSSPTFPPFLSIFTPNTISPITSIHHHQHQQQQQQQDDRPQHLPPGTSVPHHGGRAPSPPRRIRPPPAPYPKNDFSAEEEEVFIASPGVRAWFRYWLWSGWMYWRG